jgi:hypothetical protein
LNSQPTSWKIQQVSQLRAQARFWRIGTAVVVLTITSFCIALLYNSATKLTRPTTERDEFVAEFKHGLTTQVVPQAQQIVKQTWSELAPAVQTEVVKLQSRYPEIADGIEHELERLSANLPLQAEATLRDTVGEMIAGREQTIRQLYGDITPEQLERVKTVLLSEGQRRAGNITEHLVQPFEGTVRRIQADLAAIEASVAGAGATAQTQEQMTALLVKLTQDQITTAATELQKAVQQEQQQLAEAK